MLAGDLLHAVPAAFKTVLQGYSSPRSTPLRTDGRNAPP